MHDKKAVRASEDMRAVQCSALCAVWCSRSEIEGMLELVTVGLVGRRTVLVRQVLASSILSQMLPYIKVHFL